MLKSKMLGKHSNAFRRFYCLLELQQENEAFFLFENFIYTYNTFCKIHSFPPL